MSTEQELRLEVENLDLRRLLAQAGIDAAEQKGLERLQRVLLEELHHRVKNTLSIVIAITSQSLRTADSLEQGRQAVSARLIALGRVHDLLLQTNWTRTALAAILKNAIEPFDTAGAGRFFCAKLGYRGRFGSGIAPGDDLERTVHQRRQVWCFVECPRPGGYHCDSRQLGHSVSLEVDGKQRSCG